jgi:mannose-6-phosphate isomerase-like protein (cupin superfamily)
MNTIQLDKALAHGLAPARAWREHCHARFRALTGCLRVRYGHAETVRGDLSSRIAGLRNRILHPYRRSGHRHSSRLGVVAAPGSDRRLAGHDLAAHRYLSLAELVRCRPAAQLSGFLRRCFGHRDLRSLLRRRNIAGRSRLTITLIEMDRYTLGSGRATDSIARLSVAIFLGTTAIQLTPGDLRKSKALQIPNADYMERTGSENLGARLWRLPPQSANTLHKHIRAEEFYFVLEGTVACAWAMRR